jgi:hypothetical protein
MIFTILAAFDPAIPGNEAVAKVFLLAHAEIRAAVGDQLVGLFEGALVEQKLDALPRRHLAFFVLLLAALSSAASFGELVAFFQFFQFLFEVHGGNYKLGIRIRLEAVGRVGARAWLPSRKSQTLRSFAPPPRRGRLGLRGSGLCSEFRSSFGTHRTTLDGAESYCMLAPMGWYLYFLPSK